MKSYTETTSPNNEIDLSGLLNILWNKRIFITAFTLISLLSAVAYSLTLPSFYRSDVLLSPADLDSSAGGLGALAGQFGGIASLAGINLGSGVSNKSALAIEVLKSRKFITTFIEVNNLLPDLMAANSWDEKMKVTFYDTEIYDASKNVWKVDLKEYKPLSIQSAYKKFRNMLAIVKDKDSGMYKISMEHVSPYTAQKWLELLIKSINEEIKNRDVREATLSIAYLSKQLESTKVSDIKAVLYKLIEEQTKTIMFSEVRAEYVFKVIDPPNLPENSSSRRLLYVVVISMLGFMMSIFVVLGRSLAVKGFRND